MKEEKPIARCLVNEVEAYDFPFFIKQGMGVEPPQLMLEIHFFHLTDEERRFLGPVMEISSEEDLITHGFTKDDRGVYIVE